MLGFLAHLEFAVCFAGLVPGRCGEFARHRQNWRQAVLDLFALFTVPIVLLLAFISSRFAEWKWPAETRIGFGHC